MSFKYFFLLPLLFIFLFSQNAFAIEPSSILIDVSPSNPAPYENTTITLRSFSANLDSVSISWFVDGKLIITEIGKKSLSITTKNANTDTRVEAKISFPDGEITKTIIIRPSVMVLLWQATDSYVPPFYRGKALATPDSTLKVVAMPETKVGSQLASPNNMTYSWKKDYTNMAGDSGYGKSSFVYTNDYLQDSNNISVVATPVGQNYSSESNINIRTTQPKIVFYKNSNTMGTIWERALANPHIINEEEIVQAVPYYMSPKELQHPALVWRWYINNSFVSTGDARQDVMPLRVEAGTSGTSRLKLIIENSEKIFQTASKEINIGF